MDYYKLAERAVNTQNAGKKLSSQVAKLKKDTGNEQIANILTGYVVVKLYNKLSEGMLKKELAVEDAEVTQLVAAGRNLTKFDSDKGKFMLALLAANSCYGKLKVAEFGKIMRFIKDCNSSDYDDTDFEDLEETRGISEFKAALLGIPSTVNVKCRDCGKELATSIYITILVKSVGLSSEDYISSVSKSELRGNHRQRLRTPEIRNRQLTSRARL